MKIIYKLIYKIILIIYLFINSLSFFNQSEILKYYRILSQ